MYIYICISIYVYIYMYIYICISTYVYLYMYIYICMSMYIYIYSLVIPSYSLQSIVVIVVLFANTTELGHHRAQKTSANTTARLQANCRSWTKVVDHLLVRNEVDSQWKKNVDFTNWNWESANIVISPTRIGNNQHTVHWGLTPKLWL